MGNCIQYIIVARKDNHCCDLCEPVISVFITISAAVFNEDCSLLCNFGLLP